MGPAAKTIVTAGWMQMGGLCGSLPRHFIWASLYTFPVPGVLSPSGRNIRKVLVLAVTERLGIQTVGEQWLFGTADSIQG